MRSCARQKGIHQNARGVYPSSCVFFVHKQLIPAAHYHNAAALFHDAALGSAMVGRGSPAGSGARTPSSPHRSRPAPCVPRPLTAGALHPHSPQHTSQVSKFQRQRDTYLGSRPAVAATAAMLENTRALVVHRASVAAWTQKGWRWRGDSGRSCRGVVHDRSARLHFGDGAREKWAGLRESLSFSSHLQVLTQLIIKLMRPSRSGRGCCSPRRAARGKKAAATSTRGTLLRRAWRARAREMVHWYYKSLQSLYSFVN